MSTTNTYCILFYNCGTAERMVNTENDHKGPHEAGLQCLNTNRENELKRQEEARKLELKEDQESLRTEQLKNKELMNEATMKEDKSKSEFKSGQLQPKEKQKKVQRIKEKKKRDIKKMRDEVKNLKPSDSVEFPDESIIFPESLNISLIGMTGVGKSSLLNSLKFAFTGELTEFTREQTSTANFQGGNTVRRLEVRITRYLKFIDNRGVGAEDLETTYVAKQFIRQLEGRSSFAEKVDWRNESSNKKTPVKEDKRVYCTVFVFDARTPQPMYAGLYKLVKEIFEWQGRYPIGVITHVDVATPEQIENMYVVLNSAGLDDTYEVANITRDKQNKGVELSLDHQLNLLSLMKRCIAEGDRIFTLRTQIEKKREEESKLMSQIRAKIDVFWDIICNDPWVFFVLVLVLAVAVNFLRT